MRTSQRVVGVGFKRRVSDLLEALNVIAPESLSSEGDVDGLLVGSINDFFVNIGVVWDLTVDNLRLMINNGVDLVVTHSYPFNRVVKGRFVNARVLDPADALKKSLIKEYGVKIVRVHTRWDDAVGGNNDVLAELVGLKRIKRLRLARVGFINSKVKLLSQRVKRVLGAPIVRFTGPAERVVRSVMVVSGMGLSFPEFIDYAVSEGVDVLISGDANKKSARHANELGLSLIDVGSFYSEAPGIKELTKRLWLAGFNAEYFNTKQFFSYI